VIYIPFLVPQKAICLTPPPPYKNYLFIFSKQTHSPSVLHLCIFPVTKSESSQLFILATKLFRNGKSQIREILHKFQQFFSPSTVFHMIYTYTRSVRKAGLFWPAAISLAALIWINIVDLFVTC